MAGRSQQTTVDAFCAAVAGSPVLEREITDRAFAKARDRLHAPALDQLNHHVVKHADDAGLVPRWRGLRVVAADASVLHPAVRPCLLSRSSADPDQRLFGLFLPGIELMLHASVHSHLEGERSMLVHALDQLDPASDLLVLDRGYPAAWLVALLGARGINFVMRCDGASFAAVRKFMRSGQDEAIVTLNAPSSQDVADWGCPSTAPQVRLIRQVSPQGQVRVLMTQLFDRAAFPCQAFGDLYHQRWRIEEAFKRLKHRLKIEATSGLSQQALLIDVAAKVLADNLASLMCHAASEHKNLPAQSRKCNRAYATNFLQAVLPRLLLSIGHIAKTISNAIHTLAKTTQKFIKGRSQPRPKSHSKPHPSQVYKG